MGGSESSGNRPISESGGVHQEEAKMIEMDGRDLIWSVAFLVDERHIVSGGKEGKIRCWRVEDGKEMGAPMDAGAHVMDIAVSHDGKWVVSGTDSGETTVWNAERRSRVTKFNGHRNWVRAVDVSPDATKIATGSEDRTACVWSLSTGERLLGPLEHNSDWVVAVKFSPNGHLIATATWANFVRIYDAHSGHLHAQFPVEVSSATNQSLAWASDSEQLFALSRDGNIHCLDVSTRATLSQWLIHSSNDVKCIAVASNGAFVAASAGSLVSFWDTTTHKQIGSVIEFSHDIWSMALSASCGLVAGGKMTITFRALRNTLPSRYFDDVSVPASNKTRNNKPRFWLLQLNSEVEKVDLEKTHESLCTQNDGPSTFIYLLIHFFLTSMSFRRKNSGS